MITLEVELIEKIQELDKANRRKVSDEIAILIENHVNYKKQENPLLFYFFEFLVIIHISLNNLML